MKFAYPILVRVAIALLVLIALYSNIKLLYERVQPDLSFVGNDPISLYEKRFEKVKTRLPSNGVIGYLGEGQQGSLDDTRSDGASLYNWYLTQYTLAPLVISPRPGHNLFIINGRPNVPELEMPERGYTLMDIGNGEKIMDFGNGIKVVRTGT